jgi:hypothetical protein
MMTTLVICVLYPWAILPFTLINNLDPTYFLFDFISRHFLVDQGQQQDIWIYFTFSCRVLYCSFLFIETARFIMPLLLLGAITIKIRQFCGEVLQWRVTNNLLSYDTFFMDFKHYVWVSLVLSRINYSLGQLVSILLALSGIVVTVVGYVVIAMHSILPMKESLLFCFVYVMGLKICLWALSNEASTFEISKEVLRLWNFSVKSFSRKDLLRRKLRGLTPWRFYTRAGGVNLFYFKRSTIIAFFGTIFTHTVTAVLSFRLVK